MTTQTFAHIPLAHIVTSPTNPRKTFHPERLTELAASIAESGVHQPVLVRPLPAARVADTAHLEPRPTHELVSGERRVRACILAGLDSVPAMVRPLTDDQVLEVQLVENLQRDDLAPLEEAEGYDHLMHAHTPPLNADEVGAKIGKSRSYVYARLKLLDLGSEGREALRSGRLDFSRALLVARIPDTELQAKALASVLRPPHLYSEDAEPMSVRETARHIQQHFMLRLREAKFKLDDAALVPSAGSCRSCPKRTGANPDLFADVDGADVCTHPPCYQAKEQAHSQAQLAQAQANGQTIITGREAKELMPHSWVDHVEGYLRLDDASDSPEKGKPLRSLIGAQMDKAGVLPVLVANPHKDGELVAVLPRETVSELLRAKGYEAQAAKLNEAGERQLQAEAEHLKTQRKTTYEEAWRWALLADCWTAMQENPCTELPKSVTRLVAKHYVTLLNGDKCKRLAKLLALGKVAPKDGLLQLVQDTPNPWDLLMLLVAHHDVEYQPWMTEHQPNVPQNVGLLLVAEDVSMVPADVQERVQAELTAQWAAESATKPPLSGPVAGVASSEGGGGASQQQKTAAKNSPAKPKMPKLTSQAAKQSIADAMKAAEPTPGDDARGTETTPDGASAVGETSRATAPDAGATPAPTAGPDPLLIEARRIVVTNQKASVSYVQRVLKVGYNRAARLLDELEREGVVGPEGVSAYRNVLVAAPALVVAGDDEGDVGSGDGIEPGMRVAVLEGEHAGAVGKVLEEITVCTDEPILWLVALGRDDDPVDILGSHLAALNYTEGARAIITGDHFSGKHATLIEQDYNQPENQKPTRWLVRVDGLRGDYLLTEDEMQLTHPDEQPGGVVESGAA